MNSHRRTGAFLKMLTQASSKHCTASTSIRPAQRTLSRTRSSNDAMRQVALHVTSDTPSRTKNTRKWTCALRNFFPTIQFIVCSEQIKQDPLRKQALQEVRAANAQLTDVKSRKKIQAVQPHAYAVHIVDAAVYAHFRPKFAACNHAGSDSPEIRVALRKDLHSVLASSGPNCALFPHLALVRSGGSCFSVSLNRIDNDMNYPPSNVQVRNQMFLHAFVCL